MRIEKISLFFLSAFLLERDMNDAISERATIKNLDFSWSISTNYIYIEQLYITFLLQTIELIINNRVVVFIYEQC